MSMGAGPFLRKKSKHNTKVIDKLDHHIVTYRKIHI